MWISTFFFNGNSRGFEARTSIFWLMLLKRLILASRRKMALREIKEYRRLQRKISRISWGEWMMAWVNVVAMERVESGQIENFLWDKTDEATVPVYSLEHLHDANENICVDSRTSTHPIVIIIITSICIKLICTWMHKIGHYIFKNFFQLTRPYIQILRMWHEYPGLVNATACLKWFYAVSSYVVLFHFTPLQKIEALDSTFWRR